MIREIVTYPNPILKQKSNAVEHFDKRLHILLDDMYETMLSQNGIGLAAIQVGEPLRVLILNLPDEDGIQHQEALIEMINPTLTSTEGTITYQEGCLSVPGFYEDVERFEEVSVNFLDRDGKSHTIEADALFSVAIQHEMDHLEGKLFIEKLPYGKRKKFEKELKKQLRDKKKAS